MSLIQCPECKQECQVILDICPNCGFPLTKVQSKVAERRTTERMQTVYAQPKANPSQTMTVHNQNNSALRKLLSVFMLIIGAENIYYVFSDFFNVLAWISSWGIFSIDTLVSSLGIMHYALLAIGFTLTAIVLLSKKCAVYLNFTPYFVCGGYALRTFCWLIVSCVWHTKHNLLSLAFYAALFSFYFFISFVSQKYVHSQSKKVVMTCVISGLGFLHFVETINIYGGVTNLSLFLDKLDYVILALSIWVQPYNAEIITQTTNQPYQEVNHMESENTNYAYQQTTVDVTSVDGYVKIWKLILFSFLTLGIYPLIWVYRTVGLFNRKRIGDEKSQGAQVALYMFVPFYSIYWLYKCSKLTEDYTRKVGNGSDDLSVLSLILSIFGLGLVAVAIIQDQINKNLQAEYRRTIQQQSTEETKTVHTSEPKAQEIKSEPIQETVKNRITDEDIEYLKRIKDLYDMGVLDEDEYKNEREKVLKK